MNALQVYVHPKMIELSLFGFTQPGYEYNFLP